MKLAKYAWIVPGAWLLAAPVSAGVIDSPLPVLTPGGSAKHVFTIPGVIKNNNLETEFSCTSLDSVSFKVAVEVFGAEGGTPLNNASSPTLAGVETLPPGGTRTIGTGNTLGVHEDEALTLAGASIRNGSARIVAESSRISCTAFVVDKLNDPPQTAFSLKVHKAKKQAGD